MGLMETFIQPLIGGLLIGLASAVLLLGNGRIAGISGILGQAILQPKSGSWRLFFVAGLILSALIATMLGENLKQSPLSGNFPMLVLAGLLVGFGTRLGSGCTSGHGVCGISRLSVRSVTATVTFMLSAALTVFLAKFF